MKVKRFFKGFLNILTAEGIYVVFSAFKLVFVFLVRLIGDLMKEEF